MPRINIIRPSRALSALAASLASLWGMSDARAFDMDAAIGADAPVVTTGPRANGDLELSGHCGYLSAPIRGGTNPFGFGYGGRFGYARSGAYFGANLTNFVGGTDVQSTEHAFLYGLEAGYGLRVPVTSTLSFTFRPQVGVGGMSLTRTDPPSTSSSSAALSTSARVPKVTPAPDVITSASGSGGGGSSGGGSSGSSGSGGVNVVGAGSSSSSSGSGASTTSGTGVTAPTNTSTTLGAMYVQPGLVAMFGSEDYFGALDTSMLIIPSIGYSGAEPATWLAYGVTARVGMKW